MIALAIIAVVLLLQWPFRLLWVSACDEGSILQIADDLLRGRHLYGEAVHYAFPGIFYLTAMAFALFGTSVETARFLAISLFAVTCGLAYLIARWWYTGRAALVVVLLFLIYRVWAYPHWQMLSYSTLAVMLALLATWILGEGLARAPKWPLGLAGAVAGLALFSKQDSGAVTLAALGLTLLVCRPAANGVRMQRVVMFTAGSGLVLGTGAVAIWWAGFGPDMIREAILAPLYAAGHFDHARRPALWPLFAQDSEIRRDLFSYFPSILVDLYRGAIVGSALYQRTPVIDLVLKLVYHLPWMLVGVAVLPTAIWLRRCPTDVGAQRILLVALLASGFLTAFNRPHDWVHLLVLYPATLLLAAGLYARLRVPRVLTTMLVIGVAVVALGSAIMATRLLRLYSAAVNTPRGVVYVLPQQAEGLANILGTLAAGSHSTPLAALPYHPLLNFLGARPGATRFYLVWPVERNPHRDDEVIKDLEAQPDADVVYSLNQYARFPRLAAYAPKLFDYLVDHFAIDRTFGGNLLGFTFFLLRRTQPQAGESLLGDALSHARVEVESRGQPARAVVGEERDELVVESVWPFERVVRVALPPDRRLTVSYRMTPAPGERFETSYGVNPEHLTALVLPSLRFTVEVRAADGEHQMMVADVVPGDARAERSWRDTSVDLSRWAGQSIDLVLGVTASSEGPADLAGWGAPRIVSTAP
jgi:4-amino-4-deoxy-L-arabinose transferase-like glycosyltransferase